MKEKLYVLVVVISIGVILSGCKKEWSTTRYIDDKQINGTIIVSSLNTGKEYIINKERAEERFLPASTFKIPNTLIALQAGVVKDEYEVIKWDGKDKGISEWNKDQTLKTAFSASCVWFYQELAKEVGLEKYADYLNDINYGNKETGSKVDTFWLDGDIRISAKEQVKFLRNVYEEKYDIEKVHYQVLKNIMVEESTPEYILSGKTGWAQRVTPQIGWYVGYLETHEDTWFFACNLNIIQYEDEKYRKELVLRYLKDLQLIE